MDSIFLGLSIVYHLNHLLGIDIDSSRHALDADPDLTK
jgi:hypothetical protein